MVLELDRVPSVRPVLVSAFRDQSGILQSCKRAPNCPAWYVQVQRHAGYINADFPGRCPAFHSQVDQA